MKNFKIALAVILAALVIVFVLQNLAVVRVNFLFWSLETSRALMLLVVFVTGILLGWIGRSLYRRR